LDEQRNLYRGSAHEVIARNRFETARLLQAPEPHLELQAKPPVHADNGAFGRQRACRSSGSQEILDTLAQVDLLRTNGRGLPANLDGQRRFSRRGRGTQVQEASQADQGRAPREPKSGPVCIDGQHGSARLFRGLRKW
jgi:hypothetical protein